MATEAHQQPHERLWTMQMLSMVGEPGLDEQERRGFMEAYLEGVRTDWPMQYVDLCAIASIMEMQVGLGQRPSVAWSQRERA